MKKFRISDLLSPYFQANSSSCGSAGYPRAQCSFKITQEQKTIGAGVHKSLEMNEVIRPIVSMPPGPSSRPHHSI